MRMGIASIEAKSYGSRCVLNATKRGDKIEARDSQIRRVLNTTNIRICQRWYWSATVTSLRTKRDEFNEGGFDCLKKNETRGLPRTSVPVYRQTNKKTHQIPLTRADEYR